MDSQARIWLALAALEGLIAVAAGAFGAHGASDPAAKEWLRTGAQYQMVHALAVFAAWSVWKTGAVAAAVSAWLFLAGALVFGGTLYLMALGAPRWLGAVTPVGGLMLLGGWAVLAWAVFRS